MAGDKLWLYLPVLVIIGHAQAGPLPDGNNLIITTGSPDAVNLQDRMMGDSPDKINGIIPPKIYAFSVHSDIIFRFAKTLVTSKVINRAGVSQELSFAVVLPQKAFITGFVMETDNMTYHSFLTEKDVADQAYSSTVQSGKAGALLSYRDSNLFDISMHIEPEKRVTFKLSYEELLEKENGFYRHVVTVNPGQVVAGMKVKVHIAEPRAITKIFTPKFAINNIGNKACSGANMNSTCTSDNEMANKTSLSPSEVLIEFGPSRREQKRLTQGLSKGLSGQFEVIYDVERDESGGEILVKDGYFVHFFDPPANMQYLPKHIIFVLDASGSMDGQRIRQVKDAMKAILPTLRPDDLLNIIVFADYVRTWNLNSFNDLITEENGQPTGRYDEILSAFPFSQQNNETAINRIEQISAIGGTNIFGALRQGVRTAKKQHSIDSSGRKPIIFFLTDGEATMGIQDPDEIISELAKINTVPQIPIYSFSFGEGGNYTFLTKLSLANSGVARVIYQGLDANVQLQNVYNDISNAVLSNVKFKYLPEEVDLSSLTQLNYHTFFEGEEIVVSGRTIDKNAKKIYAEVTATGKDLQNKKISMQSSPPLQPIYKIDASAISLVDPNKTNNSMERAWAYLTIKQLVEKSKSEPPSASEPNPVRRAIELAKKYSFATEVTSLVVVKPDGQNQIANAQRIPDAGDTQSSSTVQPPIDEPEMPDNRTNLPTLRQMAHKKSKEFMLYDKDGLGLHDISWLPANARRDGYAELWSKNGSFTRYTILYDAEPLDPIDEPNCAIDNLFGKCRHLSLCVVREIAKDFLKYMNYYQCDLEDYLAICCPHH